ncbi:MAG: hypothetical protein NVSMB62_00360 [Acidobacteriaceae bacterium]
MRLPDVWLRRAGLTLRRAVAWWIHPAQKGRSVCGFAKIGCNREATFCLPLNSYVHGDDTPLHLPTRNVLNHPEQGKQEPELCGEVQSNTAEHQGKHA